MPSGADGAAFASPIHAVAFTYPFNLTGNPSSASPARTVHAGLPVGLQIVAARGQEHLLLKIARAWERVRPFEPWPRLPA
jgi:Asp-tRNA(Asn)/Glu-tRNA(Gln) amidotransferase A subunit family amidase